MKFFDSGYKKVYIRSVLEVNSVRNVSESS